MKVTSKSFWILTAWILLFAVKGFTVETPKLNNANKLQITAPLSNHNNMSNLSEISNSQETPTNLRPEYIDEVNATTVNLKENIVFESYDEVSIQNHKKSGITEILFIGNVFIKFDGNSLKARRVIVTTKSNKVLEISAYNNIEFNYNKTIYLASSLNFDPNTQRGVMHDVRSYLKGGFMQSSAGWYYHAGKVTIMNEKFAIIENVNFTSSDKRYPPYMLSAEKLFYYQDGITFAYNNTYRIGEGDLFYFPFYFRLSQGSRIKTDFGQEKRIGYYAMNTLKLNSKEQNSTLWFDFYERLGNFGQLTWNRPKGWGPFSTLSGKLNAADDIRVFKDTSADRYVQLYQMDNTENYQALRQLAWQYQLDGTIKTKDYVFTGHWQDLNDPFFTSKYTSHRSDFDIKKLIQPDQNQFYSHSDNFPGVSSFSRSFNLTSGKFRMSGNWTYQRKVNEDVTNIFMNDRYSYYLQRLNFPGSISFALGSAKLFEPINNKIPTGIHVVISNTNLQFPMGTDVKSIMTQKWRLALARKKENTNNTKDTNSQTNGMTNQKAHSSETNLIEESTQTNTLETNEDAIDQTPTLNWSVLSNIIKNTNLLHSLQTALEEQNQKIEMTNPDQLNLLHSLQTNLEEPALSNLSLTQMQNYNVSTPTNQTEISQVDYFYAVLSNLIGTNETSFTNTWKALQKNSNKIFVAQETEQSNQQLEPKYRIITNFYTLYSISGNVGLPSFNYSGSETLDTNEDATADSYQHNESSSIGVNVQLLNKILSAGTSISFHNNKYWSSFEVNKLNNDQRSGYVVNLSANAGFHPSVILYEKKPWEIRFPFGVNHSINYQILRTTFSSTPLNLTHTTTMNSGWQMLKNQLSASLNATHYIQYRLTNGIKDQYINNRIAQTLQLSTSAKLFWLSASTSVKYDINITTNTNRRTVEWSWDGLTNRIISGHPILGLSFNPPTTVPQLGIKKIPSFRASYSYDLLVKTNLNFNISTSYNVANLRLPFSTNASALSFSSSYHHDFLNLHNNNFNLSISTTLWLNNDWKLAFSTSTHNDHIYRYFKDYMLDPAHHTTASDIYTEFWGNLADSFNIFDYQALRRGLFKIQTLNFNLTHYLDEWQMVAKFTVSRHQDSTLNVAYWEPAISFNFSLRGFPSLNNTFNYSKKFVPPQYQ